MADKGWSAHKACIEFNKRGDVVPRSCLYRWVQAKMTKEQTLLGAARRTTANVSLEGEEVLILAMTRKLACTSFLLAIG